MSPYILKDNDMILDASEKKYILRVKDLIDEERPREKLVKSGPQALSSNELLAIVLNTGTKKEGVLEMSARILQEYGDKNIIHQKDPKRLERELNIPASKACQIVACFELGRRFFKNNNGGAIVIRTAKQAYEYLKDMRDLPKEHLRGVYLNSRYRLVHDEVISIGSLNSNIVHPREVFRPAIEFSAAAVIIAHNHPSGSVKPTEADINVTKQLIEGSRMLGIDLLDHLVITKNKFVSVIDYCK